MAVQTLKSNSKVIVKNVPVWIIAFTIMLPTAFAMIATSATNVAIPHISGAFASTPDETNWVITSYMISQAILLPLTGWLENMLGRRLFIKLFIALFTFGSIVCILAPTLNILILGRIIQGIGGGPFMPLSQAILLESFSYEKRGVAMSIFAFAVMISSILGPTYGGFVVDCSSWQWIFIMNIPVGILSIILVDKFIGEKPGRVKPKGIDFVGITALIIWLFSMQVILDKGEQYGWFDAQWICVLGAISVIAMTFFICWELDAKNAAVNLRVFKNLNFTLGTILSASINMIIYVTIVLLPMYLQSVMGYSPTLSGMSLAPRALSCIIMLPIASWMINAIDNRIMVSLGFLFLGISTLMYTNLSLMTSFAYIVFPNILLGVGVILIFVPISAIALGTLPKTELSNGAGLHSLAKCVMNSFIVSISTACVSRLSEVHQNYMVGSLSGFNTVYRQKLINTAHSMAFHGPHALAMVKAKILLYKELITQAKIFAFSNTFAGFALLAFILVPLPFFLQVNKDNKKTSNKIANKLKKV